MKKTRFWALVTACVAVVVLSAVILVIESPPTAMSSAAKDEADSETAAAFAKAGCAGCHTIPGVPNASRLSGS